MLKLSGSFLNFRYRLHEQSGSLLFFATKAVFLSIQCFPVGQAWPFSFAFLPTTSTLTTTTGVIRDDAFPATTSFFFQAEDGIRDDAFPVMLGAETAGGHFDSEFLNFVSEFLSFFQFGRSDGRHDQAGRVAFSYRLVWARL